MSSFKKVLFHFAVISLLFEQFSFVVFSTAVAAELPINPDGTTNTLVTKTASGVDQVNIAAPNSAGLSHNRFRDYNVNKSGQVINNFSGKENVVAGSLAGANALTATQIGGLVTVNPNLVNSGAAKVILNEVTSNNASRLLGYLEVAGGKADVIIANPNGIICGGCGFINTSRLTMVAGKSNFDNSFNDDPNFTLTPNSSLLTPLITIESLGLDATTTTSTDIIASSIKLLGNITASKDSTLNLIAGEGNYDYKKQLLIPNSLPLNSPLFAIDASNLSKIQAGRIYMVATSEGVGVNMAGEVLANEEVNIDAQGNIYYNSIKSGNKTKLSTVKNINSIDDNAEISSPNLDVKSETFTNLGRILSYNAKMAGFNLINSGNIESLELSLDLKDISNSGLIYGQEKLSIKADNLTNEGSVFSRNSYDIILSNALENSGFISSQDSLTIAAKNILNHINSEISANYNLAISSSTTITNQGNIIANNNINITAQNLINQNTIHSNNQTTFNLETLENYEDSSIYSAADLEMNLSNSLSNKGTISSLSKLTIFGEAEVKNYSKILAQLNLEITASNLNNYEDAVLSSLAAALTAEVSAAIKNSGEISSKTALSLKANNLDNFSNILGSEVSLTIADKFNNEGGLQSLLALEVSAKEIANSGLIKSFNSSEISAEKITNYNDALILNALNGKITATNSLTNNGSILSSGNLDLISATIKNSGEIFSTKDLSFIIKDSLENRSLENSGTISAIETLSILDEILRYTQDDNADESTLISNSSFLNPNSFTTNTGLIESGNNLTIEIGNLTNSNQIKSLKEISITSDLDNSGKINAKSNLIINSTTIDNSGTLQSAAKSTINSESLTNSSSALIMAVSDLSLNATNISNQGTKTSSSKLSSGIISASGAVTIKSDFFNNESGIVLGQSTNLTSLDATSVSLLNDLGEFVSVSDISLDLGNTDYTITGIIAADYIDITANNIVNEGNVSASDYIKLNATGEDGISGSGNITNGLEDGDNSDIQLAAGSYIDFTAKNDIINYATISATTNLTLTSSAGSIYNYNTISGGSGDTIIDAYSNFTNSSTDSVLTAANDLQITVGNAFDNYGEVSVANDLTATSGSSIYNASSASIWSGNDITLNAIDSIINYEADIYANNNITIQKDSSGNKTASVQNTSGNIETYEGDITINADSFLNQRSYLPKQGKGVKYKTKRFYTYDHVNITHYKIIRYYLSKMSGSAAAEGLIFSGKDLNLNISNDITNNASSLIASEDISVNMASLTNKTKVFKDYVYSTLAQYTNDFQEQVWNGQMSAPTSLTQDDNYNEVSYIYGAYIKSGADLTIKDSGIDVTATAKLDNNITDHSEFDDQTQESKTITIGNINIYNLEETGAIEMDLSRITNAISNNSSTSSTSIVILDDSSTTTSSTSDVLFSGNFKINLDTSSTSPLVESRSKFTDVNKFYGSSYYFDQLGVDGDSVLANIDLQTRTTNASRMLGDSAIETKLILDQIRKLTSDSLLLSKTITDPNSQIKELLDNSVSEFSRLGLSANDVSINGLTTAQANSLTKDIITFEITEIDGNTYLAPKIYLSSDTRSRLLTKDSSTNATNLANTSTIYAKDSIIIDSPTLALTNNGSIYSDGNVTLNVGSLSNKTTNAFQSQIMSNNNLSITANVGSIKNIGANIGSIGDISLTMLNSEGSILNSAIVQTNASNLINSEYGTGLGGESYQLLFNSSATNSGGITSKISQESQIKGGSVAINSAGSFTNLAADITATKNTITNTSDGSTSTTDGNISITAGDDINIETLQLRDRTETSWGSRKKGGMTIKDNTTNVGSNISSEGSIAISADRTGSSSSNTETANVNIIGSNITAAENITISATDDVNITSAQDTSYTETQSWKKNTFGGKSSSKKTTTTTQVSSELTTTNNGDITITAGSDNLSAVGEESSTGNLKIIASKLATKDEDGDDSNNSSDGDINLIARNKANIVSDLDTNYSESFSTKEGSTVAKSSVNITSNSTNVKSSISAVGDVAIESGDDVNLAGAQISADNASIEAGGAVNIYAVEDESYSYSRATKTRNFSGVLPGISQLLEVTADFYKAIPVPVIGNIAIYQDSALNGDFSSKSNLLEKNKITNQSSDIVVSNNLTINANNNINIAGSNLSGGGAAEINSASGDVNIYSVKDVDYSHSESHKSKTTAGSVAAGIVQTAAAGVSEIASILTTTIFTLDQSVNKTKSNNEASANAPQKSEQKININSDETLVASKLNFNSIKVESGNNTNITSSDLNANNSIDIVSGNTTNITTTTENDYSYSQTVKKSPSIGAALSNAVVKVFNDLLPKIGSNKGDNTKSNNDINELVYDQNKQKSETTSKTNLASNIEAGADINITSQNDNLVSGSNLVAGDSITLTATDGTTTITSAQDTSSTSSESVTQNYNDISANYNRGRTSVDSNSNIEEVKTTTNTTTQKQSVLQAENALRILSKKDLNVLSSDLVSNSGTIELNSSEGNVNILSLSNTTTTSSEIKTGTQTLSAGIGNAHVDTAYAEYDLIQATKALADAKKNLNHMETLHKNGQADEDAVEDAKINLTIATLNLALAEVKLAAAALKSAGSCAESLCTGFYGNIRLSIAGSKTNINTTSSTAVASNISSNGNIVIKSGLDLLDTNTDLLAGTVGNTTITGANIASTTGDINITSRNDTIINASKDTYNSSTVSKTWEENLTLGTTNGGGTGAAIDNMVNALQISLGLAMSRSKSDTSSTTYNNSQLTANSGTIKINSLNDATISGANLLAQNIMLNTQGDLTVESLQDSYKEKGSSFGINLGGGGGVGSKSSGSGSTNFGINYSSNKTDRLWTDNQTTLIGTNSIIINTGNNTNINGAILANINNADVILEQSEGSHSSIIADQGIDGGNLTLNTGSLTFSNLYDHEYSQNTGFGFSTSVGFGKSGSASNNTVGQGTANANNPNQQTNFYPNGSTTISAQNTGYRKEQTTKATIGEGNISTNSILTFDSNGDLLSNTGGILLASGDESLTNLNRDISNSQEITKDTITGALNFETTIDNRLIAAAFGSDAAQKSLKNEQKNLVKNLAVEAEFMANAPKEIVNEINEAVIKVYDNLNPAKETTPEVRENIRAAIRTAAITGDVETLKEQIKALTNKTPSDNDLEAVINLSKNRDFAELREELGNISYARFLDKYTLSTGIFFDGTGNDVNSTNPEYNEATNVARMKDLYDSEAKRYISGVGTSGGLDTACLAFGCGADDKQNKAIGFLSTVVNDEINKQYLFFPIDVVSFSRGATTGADFINNINNETYWNDGLLTRSHLMFDPVGSYGIAGNGFDYGKDFSTPKNIIAIQINAKDEQRNLFDLQSLKSSDGTLVGKNWTEITLPGVHADIGGGYKEDEQGKSQNIAFYSMQMMIDEAAKYGIDFKEIPQNQLPSFELTTAMNLYRAAQTNYNNNQTEENKFYLEDVNKFIQKNFVHDSTFGGSGKIYNYSVGNERGIFYPNDKYLNESTTLKTGN